MKIGDIQIVQALLDAEHRIATLEMLFDRLIARGNLTITQEDIDEAHEKSIANLKIKYPNMGIGMK